jgi:hypothetical protein
MNMLRLSAVTDHDDGDTGWCNRETRPHRIVPPHSACWGEEAASSARHSIEQTLEDQLLFAIR